MSEHESAVRWCIEFEELGVWDTLDMADNEQDALDLASVYAETLGEHRVRISTPDFKYL